MHRLVKRLIDHDLRHRLGLNAQHLLGKGAKRLSFLWIRNRFTHTMHTSLQKGITSRDEIFAVPGSPQFPMEVDYRIELDTYSGPLDLLLLLVKRHEIDLHDIPIARLTDQYLHHLELIKTIDVNLAGEFLVMAATLLEIKSALLIPHQAESADGDEAGDMVVGRLDPRYELVQQLLAYKRFKDAAMDLSDRRQAWLARFPHKPGRLDAAHGDDGDSELIEIDLEDVHVLDLCQAFGRILSSIGQGAAHHEVVYDDTPIALHAEDIADRLQRDGALTLQHIFVGRSSRSEMIGLFLATLELVRQRRVRVIQDTIAGQIRLELRSEQERQAILDQEELATDWRDPQTGDMQYDWPSEEARQRAQRRGRLRIEPLKRLRAKPADQAGDDADDMIIVDDDDPDDLVDTTERQ